MRAVVVLILIALPACQLLFDVDGPAPSPPACQHGGLLLCLAFENETTLGLDSGPSKFSVTSSGVRSVPRQDPVTTDELALEVDAMSSMVVSNNNDFDLQRLSMDLWVFYSGVSAVDRILVDNNFQYSVTIVKNKLEVQCGFLVDIGETLPALVFGSALLPDNGWHHVACTYDGTTAKAYIDGEMSPTATTGTGTINPDPTPLVIGRAGNESTDVGGPRSFTGQLDNVRVWTTVLDAPRIAELGRGIE